MADRMQQAKEARALAAAEEKLAAAAHRRDTYEFMAQRLRLEKQAFDPRFAQAQSELVRERKRVEQLRIMSTDAVQAHANAEQARRATEKRVAQRQQRERAALREQQAALLSTQQSVLHFEVSRMSRSQSAVKIERRRSRRASTAATGRPSTAAWSDPARAPRLRPRRALRGGVGGGGGGGSRWRCCRSRRRRSLAARRRRARR